MRVPYRQGLLQYQENFLQKIGTGVILSTTNEPFVGTVSYKNNEYLFIEPKKQSIIVPWNNLPENTRCWLYVDIDKNSGQRTFGYTTVDPIIGHSAPVIPNDGLPDDLHWFDMSTFTMKVWKQTDPNNPTQGYWLEKIRLFVAEITESGSVIPKPKQSQIGINGDFKSGRILFDGTGKVVKKADKSFFTTEDQWFVDGSNIQTCRLELDVYSVYAGENIPKFHVVKITDFDEVRLANYEDIGNNAIAIATEDGLQGELINISFQGAITNPDWNWTTPGAPLWIDTAGELTLIDPHSQDSFRQKQVPVARVISPNTIFFQQGLGGVGPRGPMGSSTANVSPATTTELGVVRLSVPSVNPDFPIVVGDNDPRLNPNLPRPPTAHTHNAIEINTIAYGTLSQSNVQVNLQQLHDTKLGLSGGTLTGFLTLHANPTQNLHAATKQYVDSITTGLRWIDPLCAVNMIGDDLTTPPSNPEIGDMYIIPAGASGAWSGLDGHLVKWTGSIWEDLGDWLTGKGSTNRRFGISIMSETTPGGTFTGRNNQIAIWTASTQSWSFYTPSNNDAFYVCTEFSEYKYNQFVYDGIRNQWVRFGGPQAIIAGNQLQFTGNILNVLEGPGSGLDADTLDGFHASHFALSSHLHNQYVEKAGSVMTGYLMLHSDPVNPLHAATKQYVDQVAATKANLNHTHNYVSKTGDSMSGFLTLHADPVDNMHAVTKQYVDQIAAGNTIESIPYDISFFVAGNPLDTNSRVGGFISTRTIYIDESLGNSVAYAGTPPATNLEYKVYLNQDNFNDPYTYPMLRIYFYAGQRAGTIEVHPDYTTRPIMINPGDRLSLVTASAADNSIADIMVTIEGCAQLISCSMPTPPAPRGFIAGGDYESLFDDIETINFVTEQIQTLSSTLTLSMSYCGGVNSDQAGYVGGGTQSGSGNQRVVNKINFANDTVTVNSSQLSTLRRYIDGINSTTRGYFAGGEF